MSPLRQSLVVLILLCFPSSISLFSQERRGGGVEGFTFSCSTSSTTRSQQRVPHRPSATTTTTVSTHPSVSTRASEAITSTTTLYMGGFNKAKNKQAELARKLKQVKMEKSKEEDPHQTKNDKTGDDDDDDAVDEQHAEFAKLLADKKNLPTAEVPERYQLSEQYKSVTKAFGQKPPPEPPTSNTPKVRAKDIKKKKRKAAEILEGKTRPNGTCVVI